MKYHDIRTNRLMEQVDVRSMVEAFKGFLLFCKEELGLDQLPRIYWDIDGDVGHNQPSFGAFHNENQTIKLSLGNRHPLDVMRTLAHELCHYRQWKQGKLDNNSGETGSPAENEANAMAGIIMRKWGKQNPEMFYKKPITKPVSESDEPVKLKLRGFSKGPDDAGYDPQANAKKWIKKVYSKYPRNPINDKQMVMVYGEGDDQQIAMMELVPSTSVKGAVEIQWFQAYPLRGGTGTKAMRDLQKLAAEDGIKLTLYPWDKGRISQSALIRFYKSVGFSPIGKVMVWDPTKGLFENTSTMNRIDRIIDDLRNHPNLIPDTLTEITYAVFREYPLVQRYKDVLINGIDTRKPDIMRYFVRCLKNLSSADAAYSVKPAIRAFDMLGIRWPELDVIHRSLAAGSEDVYEGFGSPKLTHKDPVEVWIKRFKDSKHPKFAGKSSSQRETMARAAQRQAVMKHNPFAPKTPIKEAEFSSSRLPTASKEIS